MVRLGRYFSVHRGQVTGGNDTWIVGRDSPALPDHCLTPCVTKAIELISSASAIKNDASLKRVVTLPLALDHLAPEDREQVDAFLKWAKARGAADGYTARSQTVVEDHLQGCRADLLYVHGAASVLVRNLAEVAHVPKEQMAPETLDRVSMWLNKNSVDAGGKAYWSGLRKFEPREIERIALPKALFDEDSYRGHAMIMASQVAETLSSQETVSAIISGRGCLERHFDRARVLPVELELDALGGIDVNSAVIPVEIDVLERHRVPDSLFQVRGDIERTAAEF